MKLADLEFVPDDCCGVHRTATVTRADGTVVGVMAGDGIYSVSMYRNGGLWKRECCVSAERVQEMLSGD